MQDFEAVNKIVTAAHVVLIAWFGLASVEESVLVDNFLKVEKLNFPLQNRKSGGHRLETGQVEALQHLYTSKLKSGGQSRLQ